MRQLYTLSVVSYAFAIRIASLFNNKAKKWISGRKKTTLSTKNQTLKGKKFYWFHCASLGEFEQARPLIDQLKTTYNKNILITFFSPSGYEQRKNYKNADVVCYLPIDTQKNAHNFLATFSIEKAFFIKYEFWFNFLHQLQQRQIKTYLISGVFRKKQLFFQPYGKWFKNHLSVFSHFFVQNNTSKQLLNNIGFTNVTVSGDTRFDTVLENKTTATTDTVLAKFCDNSKIIIAGSCWQPEEAILVDFINNNKLPENWKVIFVPHDVSNQHTQQIANKLHANVCWYSQQQTNGNIMIVDVIGVLANAYQYGDVAFIGGGFKNALHNILEPAVFGLPVLFGANHSKYPEADLMLQEGCAFEINNNNDFIKIMNKLFDSGFLKKCQQKNARFIERFKGGTKKVLDVIV